MPGTGYGDTNPHQWVESLPGAWAFDLYEGEVLIFRNAGCVHQFKNVTENPEFFSVRVFSSDISPVLARHHVFNWTQARQFAKLPLSLGQLLEFELTPLEEEQKMGRESE